MKLSNQVNQCSYDAVNNDANNVVTSNLRNKFKYQLGSEAKAFLLYVSFCINFQEWKQHGTNNMAAILTKKQKLVKTEYFFCVHCKACQSIPSS